MAAAGAGAVISGHADFGEVHDDGHAVPFGHTLDRPGFGYGHVEATGYGHHHDYGYVGGSRDHDGHDGDYSDHHTSDLSFSAATDNARHDFGHVKSSVKKAWSDFWN